MRDDERRALENLELRSEADQDRVAGEIDELSGIEPATERDEELRVERCAGIGDGFVDRFRSILQSTERRIDEGATIEAVPWKVDRRALPGLDKRSGVMDIFELLAHEFELERLGQLGNAREG